MFNQFANNTQIYLLYLFYGAAFLFLGVSIIAKDMKGSDLKLAGSLRLLAAFAILHGFCEWLELGHLVDGGNTSSQQLSILKEMMVFLNIISFFFLLKFGTSLVSRLENNRIRFVRAIPISLFLLWTIYIFHYRIVEKGSGFNTQFLHHAKTGARYLFGFTGSILSAYGLISYAKEIRGLSGPVSGKLFFAGISFIFYAVFTGLLSTFPWLPVPAELLRGVTAIFMAYFVSTALYIFDMETRWKFEQQTRRLSQAEKLASLGQLAAGIAHEINNPLTNASLGIQTLKNRFRMNTRLPDAVEKLDAVERNIDRASVIARELLYFSRQRESGFTPVDINNVISGALTLMRHKLSEYTVLQDLAPLPPIMGDPGKLEQVFINILANSIDAMPDGGTVSIWTAIHGGNVVTTVSDTGIGVKSENLPQVFDPFFTTKEIGNGTGLGLYISYGIIMQHNGNIELSSEPGKGSTLTVTLPAGLQT